MKRLYRSQNELKIACVCSGMGDYFKIYPIVFRLLFLISLLFVGPLLYIIAWIIMPKQDILKEDTIEDAETPNLTKQEVVDEKNKSTEIAGKSKTE